MGKEDFWSIVTRQERTEVDIAIATAVFLQKNTGQAPLLSEVIEKIEGNGVRNRINKSRLKSGMIKRRYVSINSHGRVLVRLEERQAIAERYSSASDFPVYEVFDTLLEAADFSHCRPYVQSIVKQINSSMQQENYDACAVMMRRLMEILLIDALERTPNGIPLDGNGEVAALQDLVSVAGSGKQIRLSRVSKPAMARIKAIGDVGAHHRRHITKRADVDDVAQAFRVLISELVELATIPSSKLP